MLRRCDGSLSELFDGQYGVYLMKKVGASVVCKPLSDLEPRSRKKESVIMTGYDFVCSGEHASVNSLIRFDISKFSAKVVAMKDCTAVIIYHKGT